MGREYDVPKCAKGVAGCSYANGTWVHTVTGNYMGKHTFVSINNHCHAPMCLSMRVYACAKGTPLSECDTRSGELLCRTDPVYGGTGDPAIRGTRFDEPGYIAIPDCAPRAPKRSDRPRYARARTRGVVLTTRFPLFPDQRLRSRPTRVPRSQASGGQRSMA